MEIIRPMAIEVVSTSAPASPYPDYSYSTVYSKGQYAVSTHKTYRSLINNNKGLDPWYYVTTGATVQQAVTITTPSLSIGGVGGWGGTYSALAGKAYQIGAIFRIYVPGLKNSVYYNAELSGYNVNTGEVWFWLQSSSGTGSYTSWTIEPVEPVTPWEYIEVENRYRVFDYLSSKQTIGPSGATQYKLSLDPATSMFSDGYPNRFVFSSEMDTVGIFGTDAGSITISIYADMAETTTLYSHNFSLLHSDGETYASNLVVKLGESYNSGYLKITLYARISSPTMQILTSNIMIGKSIEIGKTEYGIEIELVDYTVIEKDDLGNATVSRGYYTHDARFNVLINNEDINWVSEIFSQFRSVPTIVRGVTTDGFRCFDILGIIRNPEITVDNSNYSHSRIEVSGLT